MTKLASDRTLNLSTRLLSNSSRGVCSPLVRVLTKSFRGSGSSALPLSSLSCSLFPSRALLAAVFSVLLVLCHVQAHDMRIVRFLPKLFSLVFVILVALC